MTFVDRARGYVVGRQMNRAGNDAQLHRGMSDAGEEQVTVAQLAYLVRVSAEDVVVSQSELREIDCESIRELRSYATGVALARPVVVATLGHR